MVPRTAEPLARPNGLDRIRLAAKRELAALGFYLFCTTRAFCSRRGVHRAVAQLSPDPRTHRLGPRRHCAAHDPSSISDDGQRVR